MEKKYAPILEEMRRKEQGVVILTPLADNRRCCENPSLIGSDQWCENCGIVNMPIRFGTGYSHACYGNFRNKSHTKRTEKNGYF